MANMMDYLDWRGDIPFSKDPFNEVDNLVLSEIAYTDFEGIVPAPGHFKSIRLKDASKRFFELHSEEELLRPEAPTISKAPFLMKKAAESKRFSNIRISAYVNEIETESQVQFSAMCFHLPDHTRYIAFRGTDHTIVGWKEDFNMSFLTRTPGQERAARYVTEIGSNPFHKLRIGGHSKGGNFAVYGAAFCKETVKKRIIEVYSNDGPGFRDEITNTKEYQQIIPKVYSIVPEHSIVSMILNNACSPKIIKSNATGLMQHDALSWQIYGNRFIEVDDFGEDSKVFDATLRNWLLGISDEERSEFVDILFAGLTYDGTSTTDELKMSKKKTLENIAKAVSELTLEKQALFGSVLVKLGKAWGEALYRQWKNKQ